MEISPISNDSSAKFKANVKFTVDYANADSNTIDNKGIRDAGSTADIRMLWPWSALVCLGLL